MGKLEDAVLEIEDKNTELSNFAHTVSHELKAPLDGLKGLSSMLPGELKGKLSKDASKMLDMMQSKVDKMNNLIYGILEFSSVGEGIKLDEIVDFNAVVKEVAEDIGQPDLVRIEIIRKLPIIKSNRIMIHQLFLNLISNAIKYNDKPSTIIKIDTAQSTKAYNILIKDNL